MKTKFWCADCSQAAEYCRKQFSESVISTLSAADAICRNTFTFQDHWEMEACHIPVTFGAQVDWAHIPFGDLEWLYALNRHSCFVNLGKAYRYTRNEKYAEHFARLISHWMDTVPLTEETKNSTWRSLEAGLRCENWLRCLRLFEGSRALTEELRRKIVDCLAVHGNYLAKTSGDFHKLSNWGILQDHGLFLVGVFLNRPEDVQLALKRLDHQLRLQVMRDGSHWEQSPMYHCEVLHCCLDVLTIAQQNQTAIPESFAKRVHAMCTALAKWLAPGGRMLCQSDSDDIDARDMLAQGALLFQDGRLKFAAGENLFEETIWDFGIEALESYQNLKKVCPETASSVLPDSGNYMLRSDFGENAGFLHMHCGCLGSGHGHADLLHIDVGAYGEDILIDSGRYTYVDSPLRKLLKSPEAHNTTRVDETNFSSCIDSWGYSALAQPVKGEYTFTDAADYLSGMHLGYMELPAGGVAVGRKVIYLKPHIIVVVDAFYTSGPHCYEQNFHFGNGISTWQKNAVVWQGQKAQAKLLCVGDGLTTVLNPAPYSKIYNQLQEHDHLKVTKKGTGFASMITVLSLSKLGENNNMEAELIPVTTLRLKRNIPQDKAQAVKITRNSQSYVVVICHGEVISEVDLLVANQHEGYGKVLAFTPENPDGICLAW